MENPLLGQLIRERELDRSRLLPLIEELRVATRNGDEARAAELQFLVKKLGEGIAQLDREVKKRMIELYFSNDLLLREATECDEFQLKIFLANTKKVDRPKSAFQPINLSPSTWLEFWRIFKNIHEDETMSKTAKFLELKKMLLEESRTRKLVDAFKVNDDNYDKAIEQLQTRYGRDQVVIECMTRNVVALISRPVSIIELAEILEKTVDDLKTLKSYSRELDWVIFPIMEACVPQNLRAQMNKLHSGEDRLGSVVQVLRDHAERDARNSHNMRRADSASSINTVGENSRGPRFTCVFCDAKHKSSNCRNAVDMTYEERVQKIKEKHRCFSCLDGTHHIRFCRKPPTQLCQCGRRHFPIMCRTAGKNGPKQATNEQTELGVNEVNVGGARRRAPKQEKQGVAAAAPATPLTWICDHCTVENGDEELLCYVCDMPRGDYDDNQACYKSLMDLEKMDVICNKTPFECPICMSSIGVRDGIVLKGCLHTFCRDCLRQTVELGDSAEVQCPYVDGNSFCESFLLQREVRELLSPEKYEKFLNRSVNLVAAQTKSSVQCRMPNCNGWAFLEEVPDQIVIAFYCPVCQHMSCLRCETVHENMTCEDYVNRKNAQGNEKLTEASLKRMVDQGEVMNCPSCSILVQKTDGCDGVTCTRCKTMMCWATKGPRWGPKGQGDISAGCRCGVNGVRCHPNCNYCH